MQLLNEIVTYILLFLVLCILVVVFIATYNILRKSFKPTHALVVLLPILGILAVTGALMVINLINVLGLLNTSLENNRFTLF